MSDGEMDQVSGQFGTGAASDAGALAAPVGDTASIAGDLSPTAEPAAIGVSAILEGAYANDRTDDVSKITTYFVNQANIVRAPSLGFF